MLRRGGSKEWGEIPLAFGYTENSRGLGVADMAVGLRSGHPHRANAETAYHVLDVMHAIHDASRAGVYQELKSRMTRPAPFSMGLLAGRTELV